MPSATSQTPIEVAIAVIVQDDCTLIARRRANVIFGGLWEFPGGKVCDGESLPDALRREIAEELGVVINIVSPMTPIETRHDNRCVRLCPFLCSLRSGTPRALAADEIRWMGIDALDAHDFPPASGPIIEQLRDIHGRRKT